MQYTINAFTSKLDAIGNENGGGFVEDIIVQTGTSPVVPTASAITFNGAVVAAGTHPVRTDGTGVSTMALEVQISQALAAADATKIGLANFDSSSFAVDANGFVTLAGGGEAIDSIGTQTGTNPIAPTAGGLVTINGAVVAAGTNPVRSDGTGANTMAIEVQISQALAATDATKIGLSNFNSSNFSVDANGFVSLNGGGGLVWSVITADTSFTVNTGTIANKAGLLTMTLPASAAVGDIIRITGINSALGWKIAQNANQQIFFGTSSTTLGAGGSLASAAIRDSIEIVCVVAGASTVYNVLSSVGNITVV